MDVRRVSSSTAHSAADTDSVARPAHRPSPPARTHSPSSLSPLAARATRHPAVEAATATAGERRIQQRLDAYRKSMEGLYRIGNSSVTVPAAFRMIGGMNQRSTRDYVARIEAALGPDVYRRLAKDVGAAMLHALGSQATGPVHVLEVDSSWGAGGEPTHGGVGRATWAYDEGSGRWATLIHGRSGWIASPSSTSGPYEHELKGIYRPRAEN